MANPQTPQTNDLGLVSKMIDEAIAAAITILRRTGEAADHLGGGIPRGVASTGKEAPTASGFINSLLAKLADLREAQNQTIDELGRINVFASVPNRAEGMSVGGLQSGAGYRG